MRNATRHPDPSAAGDPGRSPPPARESSAAHGSGAGEAPRVPEDLWSQVQAEALRAGLDPLLLLCLLARRGLEALARMRGT